MEHELLEKDELPTLDEVKEFVDETEEAQMRREVLRELMEEGNIPIEPSHRCDACTKHNSMTIFVPTQDGVAELCVDCQGVFTGTKTESPEIFDRRLSETA